MLRRRQRADAVRAALERLGQLAAVRAEARAVVARHDEQIRSAVKHLRLDGASWSQIGPSDHLPTARLASAFHGGSVPQM